MKHTLKIIKSNHNFGYKSNGDFDFDSNGDFDFAQSPYGNGS